MASCYKDADMATSQPVSLLRAIAAHPLFLLLAGLVVIIICMALAGGVFQIFVPAPVQSDALDLSYSCLAAGLCLWGYWLFTRFVERAPFADFALAGSGREFLFGVGIGGAVMAIVVGIMALFGGYKIIGHNGAEILVGVLSVAIISGIVEEILFRGIIFRFCEQWLGSAAALSISAVLFGAAHLNNPNSSWLAAAAIAIEAGIMLGAIYMLTRRLWAAIGLHMAWNSVQGGLFGIAVSGTDVPGLLISETHGNELLTGGAFGAEASLPAMVFCTIVGSYFLWRAWQKGQFVAPSWCRFKTGQALLNMVPDVG
jgi:uncharacterized protein